MKQKKSQAPVLWAGSQESFEALAELEAAVAAKLLAYTPGQDDDDEDEVPYLFEQQGSVGVISIAGPLTNKDSIFNRLFGITSYNDIREALVYAAESPNINKILLHLNTPGGSASGCQETAALIKLINDRVKPVTAYGEKMMSAGCWLGASAGEVYTPKLGEVGSIGVIAVHKEYSKALKDEGIAVTVVRAGQYKALVNPMEPLSEAARSQLEGQLAYAYKMFVEHIAECRNVPYDYADTTMADGKEFLGQQAVDAGLADAVMSYDELMEKLLNESIDTSKKFINNSRTNLEGGVMKRTLSSAQMLAAAESGLAMGEPGPATAEPPEPATAVTSTTASDAPSGSSEKAAEPAQSAEPAAGSVAAGSVAADPVISLLQAQLNKAQEDLLKANVDLTRAREEIAVMQASHQGLMDVVKRSVSNMRVALGGAAVDLSGSSAVALLAEHKTLSEQFAASFKAGGVAATDAAEAAQAPQIDPKHAARVRAALGSKPK